MSESSDDPVEKKTDPADDPGAKVDPESAEDPVCENFQLHPRRKVCKECKRPRDCHPLGEEDIRQIQDILTSLAEDCGEEGSSQSNSEYAWIPPKCPEDRLKDYFNCFLDEEVPKHNSEGLQWRLKTLMKQIPKTDVSASACRFVSPEGIPDFEEFIVNLKKKSMYFGFVKVWSKGMPMQCPTCLILLEEHEVVVVPTEPSSSVYHPACFICSECREHLADLVHCFQAGGKIYCVRHYLETFHRRCKACDELIFDERFAQVGTDFYHKDHLRCFHCDNPLEQNKGFLAKGELHCAKCYEELYGDECQKCGKQIPLDSRFISFEGKSWHSSCFTCEKCGEAMTDFKSLDGKFYCSKCFDEYIATRCGSCKQILNTNEPIVNYMGQDFHVKCFKCCDCHQTIGTGKFKSHGELAYCPECFDRNFGVRCFKCRYAITDDSAVKYKNQPYHDECFTCHRCQARLGGQLFKTVEDNVYCVHCYGETFCRKCHSCGQPILIGDKDDVLYSYGDLRWHAECFICRVCERSLADTPFAIHNNTLICKGCVSQENTFSVAKTSGGSEDRQPTERPSKSSKEKASPKECPSTSKSPEDRRSPSKERVPAKKSHSKNQKRKSDENQGKKS